MPPILALALTLLLIALMFREDRILVGGVSRALWLPLVWILILGSRLPSQWLESRSGSAAAAYQEGSALDRSIFLLIIIWSLVVLFRRKTDWTRIFKENLALTTLLGYCLLSVVWSDFPFVALKRWFRDVGLYLTILVVLTDTSPMDAFRVLFRRFAYIALPLSLMLIKYFPEIGKGYSDWTGQAYFIGITTTKNILGSVCLVCGLFLVWDTLTFSVDKETSKRRRYLVNGLLLWTCAWLLHLADSATSSICLIIGSVVLLYLWRRQPGSRWISTALVGFLVIFGTLQLTFDVSSLVISASGRDETLTGRTDVWASVIQLDSMPVLGHGYESFWLGHRLKTLWGLYAFRPNQAHNGYLELWLNLGFVGEGLLIIFLAAAYRKQAKLLSVNYEFGMFGIVVLCCSVLYNFTEAAFKAHVMWYTLLLAAVGAGVFQRAADSKDQESPLPLVRERLPQSASSHALKRRVASPMFKGTKL